MLVSHPRRAAELGQPGWEAGGGGCSLRSVYAGVKPKGPPDATEGSCLWELTAGSGPRNACLSLLSLRSPRLFSFWFVQFIPPCTSQPSKPVSEIGEEESGPGAGCALTLTPCAACPKGCRSPFLRPPECRHVLRTLALALQLLHSTLLARW